MTVFIDDMSTEKVSLLKGELADAKRRIAHLEGLLEQRRFDDLCPWCERVLCAADDEDGGTEHSRACPAFTPEGEIK